MQSNFEQQLLMAKSRRGVNKSFCFGTGREAFNKVVMPAKLNQPDPCVPGPGQYNSLKTIGEDRLKYSMGPRTLFNDVTTMETKKAVPGPGYYPETLSIDSHGKYFVSTY